MPTSPSASILRHLREFTIAEVDAAPDRDLLERFTRGRDEEALRSRGRARSWIFEGLRKLFTERARSSSGTLEKVSLIHGQ